MLVFRVFVVIGLLVFFSSEFGLADLTYGKVGDSVVLNPGQTSGPITSVTWKHRSDLALEWFGEGTTCYRTLNGRCDLNETTGSFTIRNLTVEDSGEYTPEINNRVLSKKELQVIKPVPKPTVSKACNSDETDCNLTCEADVTSGFGPVTYEWKAEGKVLSTNKTLNITEKKEERSFLCLVKNHVSSSTSEEFPNPFSGEMNPAAVAVPVVICVLLLLIITCVLWKNGHLHRLIKICPCNKKTQTGDANSTSVQIPENQNQEGEVNVTLREELPLLPNGTETNQADAPVTPNGELHQVSQENETLDEMNSKGREALNRRQPADDGEPNNPTGNPSVDQVSSQESHLDPSDANPEPSSQTEKNKVTETSDSKEQDSPSETNRNDEGESGQNSNSEEPEPAAEGPGKPDDSTCNPSVDTQPDQENNSKGREALNGRQPADDGEPNDPTCNPSVDQDEEINFSSQESHPDPSDANPEPSSQTENNSNGKEALSGDLPGNINEDETSPRESSIEETPEPNSAES